MPSNPCTHINVCRISCSILFKGTVWWQSEAGLNLERHWFSLLSVYWQIFRFRQRMPPIGMNLIGPKERLSDPDTFGKTSANLSLSCSKPKWLPRASTPLGEMRSASIASEEGEYDSHWSQLQRTSHHLVYISNSACCLPYISCQE